MPLRRTTMKRVRKFKPLDTTIIEGFWYIHGYTSLISIQIFVHMHIYRNASSLKQLCCTIIFLGWANTGNIKWEEEPRKHLPGCSMNYPYETKTMKEYYYRKPTEKNTPVDRFIPTVPDQIIVSELCRTMLKAKICHFISAQQQNWTSFLVLLGNDLSKKRFQTFSLQHTAINLHSF